MCRNQQDRVVSHLGLELFSPGFIVGLWATVEAVLQFLGNPSYIGSEDSISVLILGLVFRLGAISYILTSSLSYSSFMVLRLIITVKMYLLNSVGLPERPGRKKQAHDDAGI